MAIAVPDWAKDAVWYQIFPERFRNGDPSNDPPGTVPWTHEWYQPYRGDPNGEFGTTSGFREAGAFYDFIYGRRYGGDLQGVREKLPYLRDLGITALYFNPIFQAASMHKYDTADYRHVDDSFGVRDSRDAIRGETTDPETWQWSASDRVFLDFLREAHRLGFRVILDGVFNHVGRGFWAFRDVLEKGRASPYADWFEITSWSPFHYRAWDGEDGALPRLRHDEALGLCPAVRNHLFAITRRWMDPDGDGDPSDGIDGWRLDVAGDINAHFWKDWRTLAKSINPDAFLVAELWTESRQWLDGSTFDGVMNYPFAERCVRFFVNRDKRIGPRRFDRQLREMLGWYDPEVCAVLQNLLGSHDTDRAASMFMNPDREYNAANRIQDNGRDYNVSRPTPECYRKLRLMVTFQMTFPGAPMLYYGDEAGMYGASDPSNRKPMLWDDLAPYDDPDAHVEPELLEHTRRMIAIRNTFPALRRGTIKTLVANDRTRLYSYVRSLSDPEGPGQVVVVLNNSDDRRRLHVPSPWPDGAAIVRLDDPASCEISFPSTEDPTVRPGVRPIAGHRTDWRVEVGRLRGPMLSPWTGAVFYSPDQGWAVPTLRGSR